MAPKADIPWTLRCKIHTVTILISAPKSTNLGIFKDEILYTLRDAYPAGKIDTEDGPIPLPESRDDITLGKLVDAADVHSGWQAIDDNEEDVVPKGKGKAVAGKASQNGNSKITIENVGLKDFALVALRFRGFQGLVQSSIEVDDNSRDWHIILPQVRAADDEEIGRDAGMPELNPETGRPLLSIGT